MRITSIAHQILRDPIEAYYKAVCQWRERRDADDTPCEYILDGNWRQRLGVSSDDRECAARLCSSIEATLNAKGIRPGPESYLFWNDGDPAFLQAIWRLIRRLNASRVVETGVAHGVTSRIILEAFKSPCSCRAPTRRLLEDESAGLAGAHSRFGKRPVAWTLAALGLAVFLVWPITTYLAHANRRIHADQPWSAGRCLSRTPSWARTARPAT